MCCDAAENRIDAAGTKDRKKLIIVAGPTATGKTALGVRLAKDLDGEIISADSMQVYRHMDIGTAKVTAEEMQGIPHHMLDVADPTQNYSIAEYKSAAKQCLEEITARGHLPIVVGGTCFYIHALLYDSEFEESDTGGIVRSRLEAEGAEKGAAYMHEKLRAIDPASAESIHANNRKRVIRALEFFELNGYPISEHNRREHEKPSPYDFIFLALQREREALYRAIDERVDRMVAAGLWEERKKLRELGADESCISMQGIGYKEDTAEEIKQNSRHYSKKQMTWLKRERDVTWIQSPVTEEDYSWILQKCMRL